MDMLDGLVSSGPTKHFRFQPHLGFSKMTVEPDGRTHGKSRTPHEVIAAGTSLYSR